MEKEPVFASGFIFKRPREGAPDFVKGNLSIKAGDAIKFINEHANATGWLNLDLKLSKQGKLYLELNQWKPEQDNKVKLTPMADMEFNSADVPF